MTSTGPARHFALLSLAAAALALAACSGKKDGPNRFGATETPLDSRTDLLEVLNVSDAPIRLNLADQDADVRVIEERGIRRTTIEARFADVGDGQAWQLAADRNDLDGTLVIEVEPAGDEQTLLRGPRRMEIEVRTPSASSVIADIRNGRIAIEGLGSPDRTTLADGPGTDLQLESGEITIRDHDGPVAVQLETGDLTVEGGQGEIDAELGFGDALVTARRGPVNLNVGRGTAQIDAARGRFDVVVGNGDIRIQLGDDWVGRYQLNVEGDVAAIVDVGDAARGRPLSRARVATGDISITEANDSDG